MLISAYVYKYVFLFMYTCVQFIRHLKYLCNSDRCIYIYVFIYISAYVYIYICISLQYAYIMYFVFILMPAYIYVCIYMCMYISSHSWFILIAHSNIASHILEINSLSESIYAMILLDIPVYLSMYLVYQGVTQYYSIGKSV